MHSPTHISVNETDLQKLLFIQIKRTQKCKSRKKVAMKAQQTDFSLWKEEGRVPPTGGQTL